VPRNNSDEVGCFAAQEVAMPVKEAGMAALLCLEAEKMSDFVFGVGNHRSVPPA
jgi:hypothetical protein